MNQLETLKKVFDSYYTIPDNVWKSSANMFHFQKIDKGQLFFSQGEVNAKIAIVLDGLFVIHHLSSDGKKWVKSFSQERHVLADHQSMIQNTPSIYNGEALEDSIIAIIDYEQILEAHKTHSSWMALDLRFLASQLIKAENRIIQELSYSAQEKWNAFQSNHQQIIKRVPQYLIASYLGISPEALSRLKKK